MFLFRRTLSVARVSVFKHDVYIFESIAFWPDAMSRFDGPAVCFILNPPQIKSYDLYQTWLPLPRLYKWKVVKNETNTGHGVRNVLPFH